MSYPGFFGHTGIYICIIFFFLNKRSAVHLCRCIGLGIKQLVKFCGRHKCISSKGLKLQPILLLKTVVSSSTSRLIYFDCHRKKIPAPTSPYPLITKPKDLLLSGGQRLCEIWRREFRFSLETFDFIKNLVRDKIEKQNTFFRKGNTTGEKSCSSTLQDSHR